MKMLTQHIYWYIVHCIAFCTRCQSPRGHMQNTSWCLKQ